MGKFTLPLAIGIGAIATLVLFFSIAAITLAAVFVGQGGGGSSSTASGTVSCSGLKGVPTVYGPYFCQSGEKYKVDPAFVAAIHWTENRGFQKDPIHHPWPCSGAGACGPSQFISDTWNSYGVDGPKISSGDGGGDGVKDRKQSLSDGLFASARYLAAIGGKPQMNESDVRNASCQYNGGSGCHSKAESIQYMALTAGEWKKLKGN